MAYTKRFDGRKFDELREMKAKVGIIKRADGSAMFQIGKTIALCAVYGPRTMYPSHDQDPEQAVLRCHYSMMAFSGSGDRVRPGPSRRSKEISMVMESAISAMVDLTQYPNKVIDVFVELLQTDSGTRCAGICAASMALAEAGVSMKDLITSIAVGKVGETVVLDLTKEEEDYKDGAVDIAIAMSTRTGKITLLQLDGEIKKDELKEALKLGKKGCEKIKEVQVKALKEKYNLK